ncbi:MAG TPA: RidA family protein [Ktedonobacterales bacterium]
MAKHVVYEREGGNSMPRERIQTQSAPAPIGPYSQAIATGELIFASGQIALDPASGEFTGGDVQAQTRRALENLSAVLQAAGSSLGQVVKTTVFLTSMANFAAMNAVYGEYFVGEPPARSTIGVAELPKNALVEIEVVATRQSV